MKAFRLGKGGRIALLSFSAMVVLLLLVMGAGLFLAQSDWLREQLRNRIVSELERSTGGRVELGTLQFDLWTLHAEVLHLVIHGKEPADQAPLLSVDRVAVGLKVISFISRKVDLQSVAVETPKVHLIFYPGGGTNVPEPKVRRQSKQSAPEAILNLKIGVFDLRHGLVLIDAPNTAQRRSPFEVQARNLASHVTFDGAGSRYSGSVSASPVRLLGRDFSLFVDGDLERDRATVKTASIATSHSQVELSNGSIQDFVHPVATGDVSAKVSIEELGEMFHWPTEQGGIATVAGKARFASLQDFQIAGQVHGEAVHFRLRTGSFAIRNARVDTNYTVGPTETKVDRFHIATLGGVVEGSGGIHGWNRFDAKGRLNGITLRNGAATFTKYSLPYDAKLMGDYRVGGEFRRIEYTVVTAEAALSPVPGSVPVNGFASARYDGPSRTLSFGDSTVDLPRTHVEASGTLNGHLDVHAVSTRPEEVLPFFDGQPVLPVTLRNGSAEFRGTVDGFLTAPTIAGHGEVRNVEYAGLLFDAASGDIKLANSGVTVAAGRLSHQGFAAQVNGAIGFSDWKASDASAVSARVRLQQADLIRVLILLKQKDVPLRGFVDGTASVSGTLGNPVVLADLRATRGDIAGEPYDSVNVHLESPTPGVQTATGELVAGPKRASVQARYTHGADKLLPGSLMFQAETTRTPLAQLAVLHKQQPSLAGFGTLKSDGVVAISNDAKGLHYRFSRLDGNLDLTAVQLAGRSLGDARVTAATLNDVMTAHITSNLAQTAIQGEAKLQLSGDYPIQSQVSFKKLDLNTAWKLAAGQSPSMPLNFEGSAEGVVNLNGPLAKPDLLTGSVGIPSLSVRAMPATGPAPATIQTFVLKNAGTLRASLAKNFIHFDDVRFDAPSTNIALTGTVGLAANQTLDLRALGKVNLQILDGFSQDLRSQGVLNVNATLRGTVANPDFSGRADLTDGDFHVVDFSNGLTNAKGSLLFNGSRATIQSLSAESGGGTVDATGFLALSNGMLAFNLDARAHQLRVRYPEGVSTVADADLTVVGTSQRSLASGQVRIRRLTINPRSGATGVIAKSVEPIRTPSASAGLLANLNLDVQVETTPDVAIQTSLAQTLQGEASLRLRGTATNPALLGRVTVTEGEIVFFGNKYTVTQGTISFFNPVRVEPILNVDLETKARGVQIIITVSGPMDKPLNVTYRSDPPLQFSDILALLATGRSPTDPSLALRDTTSNQSLQQLGASALLGQAIANPVSGRLQRFFGVSKLKIDPQLSGITGSPQARLTIEQQVTPDVLFTYITDVSSTSTQLIRVEWAVNRTWSAILTREENGYVGLDFAYKKRFK